MSNDNLIPLQLIDPNEKKIDGKLSYNEVVNSFLKLANEHWQTIEIEAVSSAIREAAARFNAYEADYKSGNLYADRENAINFFRGEYTQTLSNTLDEHIAKGDSSD
jgi:hypothetical protein